DRLAVRPVLGLGEEVGCAGRRIRRLVRDDEHLARPCRQIDPYPRRDEQLRRSYEPVARADDLVDRRDGPGARRQARDRPRAPAEQCDVAPRPDVGDDLRRPRQRVLEARAPHGTSLSTGTTRIDEAPTDFSCGKSSQISSTSTAAWTAI